LTWKEISRLVSQGGPGFCQLAITNACNARCRFCNFPKVPAKSRLMADPERLLNGLTALKEAGVCYLSITGGEPLLYPELKAVLGQARKLGINTLLCTNGSLLTPELIRELREAGLDTIIISVDAASPSRHDAHRGLPGLTAHIRELLPVLRAAGLHPVASVTLSRLVDDLGDLLRFLEEMGFRRVTFSYPVKQLQSSYLGFADHYSVDFTPQELCSWFAQINDLRRNGSSLRILNPSLGISDLQRQLRGRPVRFPCLAGYKYFFVDWHLEVYRCHYLPETLGPLEEIHRFAPIRDGCVACTIDCYRDPSVYQYVAVSVADALAAWRQGKWLKSLTTLLHPYNFLSLAALLEGRHWLRG
jgi:MoaA/NifB/PqqE/SkfB family radical SAM enzyme